MVVTTRVFAFAITFSLLFSGAFLLRVERFARLRKIRILSSLCCTVTIDCNGVNRLLSKPRLSLYIGFMP